MPKINVLPDHIASQIAAGEVVERPSSVVKELVENAIDAKSKHIEINVSGDCLSIRVADDGCGMEPDDAVLAFQRHATSKISSVHDLSQLLSLGFRGEALPSIASVSKFSCTTKTEKSDSGVRVETKDGKVVSTETGCSVGCVMEVNDLFFNVPARLKFLKKAATEFNHIEDIVLPLAVAYPHISFDLKKAGKTVFKTSGSGDLKKVLAETDFINKSHELCRVESTERDIDFRVEGYLARPDIFRSDRKGMLTIVNGRPVRCPLSQKALEYAYSDLIPRGRYPVGVISLTVPPHVVDVNIHPTKKEIKYQNSQEVYLALHKAIGEALRQLKAEQVAFMERSAALDTTAYSPSYGEREVSSVAVAQEVAEYSARTSTATASQLDFKESLDYKPSFQPQRPSTPYIYEPASSYVDVDSDSAQAPASVPMQMPLREEPKLPVGWRLAGYLHNTYFVVETPEGMEIIEQHIAHERSLYEQILAREAEGAKVESQTLIISEPLGLGASEIEILKEHNDVMEKLGFKFNYSIAGKVSLAQVPLNLPKTDYVGVIRTLLEDLELTDTTDKFLAASKSLACQSAIKNGMFMSDSQIYSLLSMWLKTERNDTCPHGRPVRLKFSKEKLFEMFHPM